MKIKNIFKNKLFWSGVIIIILIIGLFIFLEVKNSKNGFEVDKVLLKLSIKQGTEFKQNLFIKNNEGGNNFEIKSDLDFISVSETEFWLDKESGKDLELNFNIGDQEPGIYFGSLMVSKGKEMLDIPVILEIETTEVLFDSIINVPPEYSKVYIGDKLVIENKVFNLEKIGAKNIEVDYFIQDLDGKTIFSDKENIVVETQILNNKVIQIPSEIKEGKYLLGIIMKYSDSVGSSSYFFQIEHREIDFGKMNFWIVFILLLVVLVFVIYNTFQRNMFLTQLERQRKRELRMKCGQIKKERFKVKKIKHVGKRRKKLSAISKKHKKTVKVINRVYKSRAKTLKKLKKRKKKSEIQKKLKLWKRQGVNIGEFGVGKNKREDLGKKANKFKKQGYKLG